MCPALIVAAILYSAVGHGGASGYMAVMVMFGLAPEVMRPVALSMNIAVTSWILWRHRQYRRHIVQFTPLILAAIPAAFIGGLWRLTPGSYQLLLGVILLASAARMFWPIPASDAQPQGNRLMMLLIGVVLGLVAGLTGVGGGIFLSPLLVVLGWCSIEKSIAPVAAFIWCNSIAGLSGFLLGAGTLPSTTGLFVSMAFIGCLFGAEVSLQRHRKALLSNLLASVLLIAGGKMFILGLA